MIKETNGYNLESFKSLRNGMWGERHHLTPSFWPGLYRLRGPYLPSYRILMSPTPHTQPSRNVHPELLCKPFPDLSLSKWSLGLRRGGEKRGGQTPAWGLGAGSPEAVLLPDGWEKQHPLTTFTSRLNFIVQPLSCMIFKMCSKFIRKGTQGNEVLLLSVSFYFEIEIEIYR